MARALFLLLAAATSLPAAPATAEVRRCETVDGLVIYTDRRCETLGAVERKPPPPALRGRMHREACPRSLRDLGFEVGAAIESQDVNRLAAVYHWPGTPSKQAFSIMDRLERVVARPLVEVQPVYAGMHDDALLLFGPARLGPPVALRVEQVSAGGATPVRTVFGLERHLECWWLTGGTAEAPGRATSQASAPALPQD